jgi:hypothetical protein
MQDSYAYKDLVDHIFKDKIHCSNVNTLGKNGCVAATLSPFMKKVWYSDPAIPLLTMHLKECAPGHERATYTPMPGAALFTSAKL